MKYFQLMKIIWPFPICRFAEYCPLVDNFLEDVLFDDSIEIIGFDHYTTKLNTAKGRLELWTSETNGDYARFSDGYINGKLKWINKMPSRWVAKCLKDRIEKLKWEKE